MKISAAEFKAKCLKIMDRVQKFHQEVIVTKFGKPVVRIIPFVAEKQGTSWGKLKGTALVEGDIVSSTGEKWDAEK